jgi:DNA-directed RNA polymerase specialized sigma subunit
MTVSLARRKMAKKRSVRSYPGLTKAQQKLVLEHQWVAGYEAHRALNRTWGHTGALSREDLTQVALFALCVAAVQFDTKRGIKFSTYACSKAKGYIQHALRDKSRMVRTPRWVEKIRNDVLEGVRDGKSYSEIAKDLEVDESKIAMCHLAENNYHLSYDSSPEDWVTPEFIHNDDEVKSFLLCEEVRRMLVNYEKEEIAIIVKYAEGKEIAEKDREWAADQFFIIRDTVYGIQDSPSIAGKPTENKSSREIRKEDEQGGTGEILY